MSKILIIDDDAALELLAENLRFRGHEVERFSSASQALDSLDKVLSNNLVILDILMDMPDSRIGQLGQQSIRFGLAIIRKSNCVMETGLPATRCHHVPHFY